MSEWWKTAKDILKGKAKGSKLIVLGVFLVGIGGAIHISTGNYSYAIVFEMFGSLAFGAGVGIYSLEAKYEIEKRREKDVEKRE